MQATAVAELPVPGTPRARGQLAYEAKWDGWRCLAFVGIDRVHLQSRHGRDLSPYFPDVVAVLRAHVPPGAVVDGELVSWDAAGGRTSFPHLQQRITAGHGLAAEATAHPAHLVAFDLLADIGGVEILDQPLAARRGRLERLLADAPPQLPVCPQTLDVDEALQWMREWAPAGVEGLVVKDLQGRYDPGGAGWLKYRTRTTTEAVIGGVTGDLATPTSLLLGRFDDRGRLRYVARTHRLTAVHRRDFAGVLLPATAEPPWPVPLPTLWTGQFTGEPVRYWPVLPAVVVEIEVDTAYERGRWRHHVRHVRVRADLQPADIPRWAPGRSTE